MSDETTTLRDTFAAAALTGMLRKLRPGSVFDLTITARQAFEIADAMLRERARNGAPDARETVTDHDAAPAAKASLPTADHAVCRGRESGCGTGGTTREPVDVPATWQDECVAVEDAFARSNVRPTWPDDEPANIGPMANAMADEITSLREEVAKLRMTDSEREAMETFAFDRSMDRATAAQTAATLRNLLARLGGDS